MTQTRTPHRGRVSTPAALLLVVGLLLATVAATGWSQPAFADTGTPTVEGPAYTTDFCNGSSGCGQLMVAW